MYQIEDKLRIQSNKYFTDSIPLFLIKVSHNMKFECYHSSVRSYPDSLSRNRITTFSRWSQIEEAIRFLNLLEVEHKKSILKEQVEVMTPQVIGKKIYEPSILVRSFEYFFRSRSLYNRLRYDYKLPIKTFTILTSKTAKLSDLSFLSEVFTKPRKMHCFSR